MSNPIAMLFISIFAVIIMFLVPAYQIAAKQDDLAHQLVSTETTKFVDSVRTKGYVTAKMLADFKAKIEVGSYLFRLEMVHEKKIYTPIYTDPSDFTSFTGEYEIQYEEFHAQQINDYLYNGGNPKKNVKYKMSEGDFFSVRVENMNKTQASILFDSFQGIPGGNNPVIVMPYGGMVLNENY